MNKITKLLIKDSIIFRNSIISSNFNTVLNNGNEFFNYLISNFFIQYLMI